MSYICDNCGGIGCDSCLAVNKTFTEICEDYISTINMVKEKTKIFEADMESVENAFTLEVVIDLNAHAEKVLLEAFDAEYKTSDKMKGMKILAPYMER